MRFSKLKDSAELIGIAAIVASLIFVGLQLRQAQEIAHSAAYQSRADSSLALKALILESETLLSGVSKALSEDSQELTQMEEAALRTYVFAELVYLENTHYQYTKGILSEEQWQSNYGDLKSLFSIPYVRSIWDDISANWRASFISEVEKVLLEIEDG